MLTHNISYSALWTSAMEVIHTEVTLVTNQLTICGATVIQFVTVYSFSDSPMMLNSEVRLEVQAWLHMVTLGSNVLIFLNRILISSFRGHES